MAPARIDCEILLISGVPSSKLSTFLPVTKAKISATTDPIKVAKTRYFSMFFSLSVPNCCEIRNLLFCSGNIIKKNSAHVKFSHFFWVRLKKCPVLFVILPATFLRKNFPFCGIYIRFFPSRGRCTIRLECIFRHDIPRYFRYKNFFMQLFHLYWYHFLKKHSRNPFSHFLLRFFAFPNSHAGGVC